MQEVLLGFAIALVLGFAFAVALHLSDTLRRAFYPLLVASQTVPVIAIAPILVVWLGFGIGPKLAIIALVCFFPITVNTLDGLRSVDPELPRMMRTLDASRSQTLRRVEVPSALPFLLSGAKIAAVVSVIGAVFGEWSGADEGLGHLILVAQGQLQTARVFAAVVVLSALAIALFGALALVERRLAWWSPRREPEDRREPRALARAALVLAATVAAGCGEKQESRNGDSEPLTLALDFYVNPDHAGIYTALDRGYFDEAGLEVEPQVPSDPSAPIRQVAAGRADLAISYEPEVLLARDQGLPVVAVAALVSRPLTSLISLPEAGIDRPADLAARRSPPPGIPYQADYLDAILERAGVDPDDVEPGRRRPQPAARGALRPRRRDARRLPQHRGRRPRRARRATRAWSRSTGSGSRPTTSSSWSPTPTASPTTPSRSGCSSPRSSAAPATPRATRPSATEAILDAGDGLDPKLTRAEVDRDAAAARSATSRASRSAT